MPQLNRSQPNMASIYSDISNASSLNDLIELVFNSEYDFQMEPHLDSLFVQFFKFVKTKEDACRIVDVFDKHLGPYMVCREKSYRLGHIVLLGDLLIDMLHLDNIPEELLYVAGDKFLLYYECDMRILFRIYCNDHDYVATAQKVSAFEYPLMKEKNKALNEELQQVMFSPKRIQKWIESGNDLEDYLN